MTTQLTKGKFGAVAREWALSETSKGTPQVAVDFDITTEGYQGEHVTWYGYLSEATYERTVKALRTMGWEGDDLSSLQGLNKNEVELVLDFEEYEGKQHLRVQWVNAKGGLAITAPMPADKAKAFAAQMRERIRALDAEAGTKKNNGAPAKPKPAANRTPEPPPHSDLDAPPF